MKKFVALLLAAMMLLAMVACGNDPQPTPDPEPTPEPTVDTTVVDELYAAFDASMAEQLGETPPPMARDWCCHHLPHQSVLGQYEGLLRSRC